MGLLRCCSAPWALGLGWAASLRITLLALLTASLLSSSGVRAQDSSALIRLLGSAHSFRVRVRAALALVHSEDGRAIAALESALVDSHPAVRAAAASTLGQIGNHASVPALRLAASDAAVTVANEAKGALRSIAAREVIARALAAGARAGSAPSTSSAQPPGVATARSLARVRFAVVLGEMRDQSPQHDGRLAAYLGDRIAEELGKLDSVAVFSLAEMTEGVTRELSRHKVPAFRLEGVSKVSGHDPAGRQLRCEVSLLLMDEPERTLRGLLKGAATSSSDRSASASGERQALLIQQTLRSATHGAMVNALSAIEAAAVRRDLGADDIRAQASLR